MLNLQARFESNKPQILSNIAKTDSLLSLQSKLAALFDIQDASRLQLLVGFPPTKIDTSDAANVTIEAAGISNQDSITISLLPLQQDQDAKLAASIAAEQEGDRIPHIELSSGGMQSKEMPPDNSCLYHAIAYVANDKSQGGPEAYAMRQMVAQIVESDPEKYDFVFLGLPNEAYRNEVLHPESWGGAIELSIFAKLFQTEIVAFDYHYRREDFYGDEAGYTKRVFLVYTGNHYDALVYKLRGEAAEGVKDGCVTVFDTKDDAAWIAARKYAAFLHETAANQGKCDFKPEWNRQGPEDSKATTTTTTSSSSSSSSSSSVQQQQQAQEWTCAACSMANVPSAGSCHMCGTANPSYVPPSSSSSSVSVSASGGGGDGDWGEWVCAFCTVRNGNASATSCEVCGLPREGGDALAAAEPQVAPALAQSAPEALIQQPQQHSLHANLLSSMMGMFQAQGGGNPVSMQQTQPNQFVQQPPPIAWQCLVCQHQNPATSAQVCINCSSLRPMPDASQQPANTNVQCPQQ